MRFKATFMRGDGSEVCSCESSDRGHLDDFILRVVWSFAFQDGGWSLRIEVVPEG